MTLNTTYSPTVADGNGVTTSFSYSFNPISENYLKVSLEQNGEWVEQVSGWTATVSENGGVVTFDTAPTTRVAIERDVPEEQPTSYKTSSGFQAQVIEHSFDMLTGMVQELKEKSDRSIAVDVGSSVNPDDVVHQVERVYSSIDNIDDVADDLTNIDTVAGDLTNIDTVAGDKANIDAVAPNISKVNTVANSMSAVNTVATHVAAVNAVANIRNQVIIVAANSAAINAVNNNKTNIDIVANNKSDVNTVASNMSSVVNVGYNINHISRVDANKDNIDAVADDITNVNRVGGSISNVNAVAAGLSDISDVLDNMTNIDTVAGSITNVNLVGADISKVAGVADDLTNIDAVNANKTNIDKVASIKDDVTAVASIKGDVMTVAADAATITAVNANKTNIDTVATDKVNVDSVANNINSVNVVADKITNVNTVATNIGAVNTAANNINAINNAPTYAAQAKQWAIGVPGEPSGGSAKYWAERAEDAASGMENPANRDLSNLSADGQMVIDSQNGTISNCVLDIPQNIKLELSNNVLTLKSGSVITLTGSTYSTVTTIQDNTLSFGSSAYGKRLIIFPSNSGGLSGGSVNITNVLSGDTLPETGSVFFNTDDKLIYTHAGGEWNVWNRNYPICIVDCDSEGNVSFAKDSNGNDMIFNGAGFVGHHIFIYPNINAYTPAGLNPDGSLASTKVNTNALRIIEALSGYGVDSLKRWISLQSNHTISNWSAYKEVNHDSEADYTIANIRYYARDINLIKRYNSGSVSAVDGVPLVEYYYDGSNITSFSPKQCVRLATVEMLDKVQVQVDTNTTAITGKQDTLVSGTNIKTINSNSVLGSGNFALANQSLSNLDSTGQMIVDSQNGTISNCILEIPQNIKVTLENNVLTLKAGSVITLAQSTYATITTTVDKTYDVSSSNNGTFFVFTDSSGMYLSLFPVNTAVSGETDSLAGTTWHTWFDTTNKVINRYTSDASTPSSTLAYPLCVIIKDSNGVRFAKDSNGNDMIFNGAGFVGHHAFVYPNVKALIPDGFNDDGSLKSISRINNGLRITELYNFQNHGAVFLTNWSTYILANAYDGTVDNIENLPTNGHYCYVKTDNAVSQNNNGTITENVNITPLVFYTYDGTTVTDFTIRQPVRTATVEMLKDKQADLTTVSGYDATTTQVLKHINGVLTWVTEE